MDTTYPVLDGPGAHAAIDCFATRRSSDLTASDACGGATVVQDSDTTAAGSCANSYSETVTWHAVDACGNTSGRTHSWTTVMENTHPPLSDPADKATTEWPATSSFTALTAS